MIGLLHARAVTPSSLAVVSFGYGLYHRESLELSTGRVPGYWDLALDVTSNIQFISFAVVPLWTLYCFTRVRRSINSSALLRHGSRRRLMAKIGLEGTTDVGWVLVAINIGVAVSALGLPLEARTAQSSTSMSAVYSSLGLAPLTAWLFQLLMTATFLVFLQAVINACAVTLGRASPIALPVIWFSFLGGAFSLFGETLSAIARSSVVLAEAIVDPGMLLVPLTALLAAALSPGIGVLVDKRGGPLVT